jgi:hypothetical protein
MVSLILQPIFLFAFLAFLLAAFDAFIYSGEFSLFRTIAGNQIDNPSFNMVEFLQGEHDGQPFITKTVKLSWFIDLGGSTAAPAETTRNSGVLGESPAWTNVLNINPSAALGWMSDQVKQLGTWAVNELASKLIDFIKVEIPWEIIDFEAIANYRGMPVTELSRQLILAIGGAAAFMFLINSFIKYIPELGAELSSYVPGTSVASVRQVSDLPFERNISGAVAGATESLRTNMTGQGGVLTGGGLDGAKGTAKGIWETPGAMARGFMRGGGTFG